MTDVVAKLGFAAGPLGSGYGGAHTSAGGSPFRREKCGRLSSIGPRIAMQLGRRTTSKMRSAWA